MKVAAGCFLVGVLLLVGNGEGQLSRLEERNSWRQLDYNFPTPDLRQEMIDNGSYIPENIIPLDVDVDLKNRVFLTLTPLFAGVPATLATLSQNGDQVSPLMDPYPSWTWYNQPQSCSGITSVYRIKIDECNRLWVIDQGEKDIVGARERLCPKKIFVFDLNTDQLIQSHIFPQKLIPENSIITNIAVDVQNMDNGCQATYAYIADTQEYSLIVYDALQDRSWRIVADNFWPLPMFYHFTVAGVEFDLPDGILGLAVSPKQSPNNESILYYTSAASNTQNYVQTLVLQNETLFTDIEFNPVQELFQTLPATRKGQTYPLAISTTGVMFYSEIVDNNLVCWNINTPYAGINNPVVDRDDEKMQFSTGIKAVRSRDEEEIWVVTNRLQKSLDGSRDTINEINFRILRAPVKTLIAGTACE